MEMKKDDGVDHERLAEVRSGTVRLSRKLESTEGAIILHSLTRFPIDPRELNVGLLFILKDDEVEFRRFLENADIGLPSHILHQQEFDLLSEMNPRKVLDLTNDYIVLHGDVPPSINSMRIKNAIKERMINGLSEAILKCRMKDRGEGKGSADPFLVKYALGQTIVSAADLHRLEDRMIRTRRAHLVSLFNEIPSSREPVIGAYSFLKGDDDKTRSLYLPDMFCDLVFIPLLRRLQKTSMVYPALPPVPDSVLMDILGKDIFRSIYDENRRIRSSLGAKPRSVMDSQAPNETEELFFTEGEETEGEMDRTTGRADGEGGDPQDIFTVIGEMNVFDGEGEEHE